MGKESKILIGIGLASVALVIAGAFLFSKAPADTTPQPVSDSQKTLLVKDDSHQTSKEKGKISVVEFADFQCPACGAGYPYVKQMEKEFGENVNFVFRHFPLDGHKNAMIAALASEAASEQGKFFEMEEKLFSNQEEWSNLDNPLDTFVKYAESLSLDKDKFKKDVEAKKNESRIKGDYQDGITLGVTSTPTFFINGKKYVGVLLADQFKTAINKELEGK